MSLNKAIEHGKEHRKKYSLAKSVDSSCRNHGSCKWCRDNREYATKKVTECADYKLIEYFESDE